jgi:glycosyltransferase involved in cell wall biosynthesis
MSVRSDKSLRIAHVQATTLDLFGQRDEDFGDGVRFFLPNIAEAQVRLGHRPTVRLLTSQRPSRRHVNGFDVHFHRCLQPPARAGLQKRFGRQLSLGLLRSLRPEEIDLVHFYGLRNSQLMLAAVSLWCSRSGIPLVAHDQGRRIVGGIEAWTGRYALPKLSACIVSTTEASEQLAASGFPVESTHVVPNGYDPRIFSAGPEPRGEPDPLRVLLVSRLTAEKDPLTVAKAVAALGAALPVELTVAGEGPLSEKMHEVFSRSSAHLRLLGHVPQHELGDIYRGADVFVLTSLHEGSNQSVIEAMASGLPVVATDVPGLRDAVS